MQTEPAPARTQTADPRQTAIVVQPERSLSTIVEVMPSVIGESAPGNLQPLSPEDIRRIDDLAAKLDFNNPQSILVFGVEAQRKLSGQSDQILENVRNKDSGPAGKTLNDLVTHVRGLGVDSISAQKRGMIENLLARFFNPLAQFIQRYETTSSQMESIVASLESHAMQLSRDVILLENLFKAALAQFHELELYILAGDKTLADWNARLIPELQAKAQASGNLLEVQAARDAMSRRDDLDRKIQDLRLTRTATLQSLPQIRMVQEVDKSLVNKIQTSILTTIPIWKSQIALAITLYRQRDAIDTQKKVADATNEMLRKNAELVQQNNADARREIERGVIDIETLKEVNDRLLNMIQDSIQITREAKDKRIMAAQEMVQMESSLKQALVKTG